MKIGDLITYTQSPDNQVFPAPFHRVGTIIGEGSYVQKNGNFVRRWRIYWHDSQHDGFWDESGLELAR